MKFGKTKVVLVVFGEEWLKFSFVVHGKFLLDTENDERCNITDI